MTPLHLPDRAEQTRIANFLDERTAQIDGLRSHCREHIALLREYRSSLISAAVTGQLDIDNFGIGG
jgi:type I restriction enzyme S subunit